MDSEPLEHSEVCKVGGDHRNAIRRCHGGNLAIHDRDPSTDLLEPHALLCEPFRCVFIVRQDR